MFSCLFIQLFYSLFSILRRKLVDTKSKCTPAILFLRFQPLPHLFLVLVLASFDFFARYREMIEVFFLILPTQVFVLLRFTKLFRRNQCKHTVADMPISHSQSLCLLNLNDARGNLSLVFYIFKKSVFCNFLQRFQICAFICRAARVVQLGRD
jgi:hypothetical protein